MRKGILAGITIILMIVCWEQVWGRAGRVTGDAVIVNILESNAERVVIRYKFGDFRRGPVSRTPSRSPRKRMYYSQNL